MATCQSENPAPAATPAPAEEEARLEPSTLAAPKDAASHAAGPAKRPRTEAAAFAVGTVVDVESRHGPGWKGGNGGPGKIRKMNTLDDGSVTYDVKYFMNGSERGVLPEHVRLPRNLEEREVVAPSNFEPENFVALAAARAAARAKVLVLRAAKKKRLEAEQTASGAASKAPKRPRKKAAKKTARAAAAVENEKENKKENEKEDEEEEDEEADGEVVASPAAPVPVRPSAPPGLDAVQQTVVRMCRETLDEEFEMTVFLDNLARHPEGAALSRAQANAALNYMEEDCRLMCSAGMIYII